MAENEFVSDTDEYLVAEAINLDIEEVLAFFTMAAIYAISFKCQLYFIIWNKSQYLLFILFLLVR